MDVKHIFLNRYIVEKVFVEQSSDFENNLYPDYVYKLYKPLYGLKQASHAQYDRLSSFLLKNNFIKKNVDTTLFLKKNNNDLLVVQIYVDDIIFGATNESL